VEKKWYQSKIFWASVVAVLTAVGGVVTNELTIAAAVEVGIGALIAIFRLFFSGATLTK